MAHALILTYHGIDSGRDPRCVAPSLFESHADVIASSGRRVLTVGQLTAAITTSNLTQDSVVITFDDGFASVVDRAAPILLDRGLSATIFCVAGQLGGTDGWPSARPSAQQFPLMVARELAELAAAGFEIGSHGMEHEPLVGDDEPLLRREIVDSRLLLEQTVGVTVRSFAYPYGAGPSPLAQRAVEATYAAACTTRLSTIDGAADVYALPRIDSHYVRRPELLRRAISGSLGPYLRARNLGARARRKLVRDYA